MSLPLVSAVIPVYNGERYLAETLQSVLSQDYPELEIVVVDDGSVDGTAAIARGFKQVRYVYRTNQGQATARNEGITVSSGELLAFLDADDLWTPNKLSTQVNYMLEHPDVGYTLARQSLFMEPGTDVPAWLREDLLHGDHVGFFPSTLVAWRWVFEQIGFYDPSFRIGESADWFARAKDAGIAMEIVPAVLLNKRVHGDNLTHNLQTSRADIFRALRESIRRQRQADITPDRSDE